MTIYVYVLIINNLTFFICFRLSWFLGQTAVLPQWAIRIYSMLSLFESNRHGRGWLMAKKLKERAVHVAIIAFLCGLFAGIQFSFLASAQEPSHKYLDYFHQVYQIIRSEYVDESSPKDLFFGAIKGMINSLDDPFSRFLDEKSYGELKEMTTGKFVGVGVEITIKDDEIVVITPIEDSPAMKAGIQTGDVIVKVDGKPIKNLKLDDVIGMIKGLPKTHVTLSVRRHGFKDFIDFEMERGPIKIKSVEFGIIKENSIGYLRIKNFGSETSGDVIKALKSFNAAKVDKVIIDLRNNPGGLLSSSIEIAELFLEKGKVIVSTRGREGAEKEKVYRAENKPIYTGRLMVLVNNGSASASEILAGAIRDNKRGKLVGLKTFGKGSVQKSFNLGDEIGVAITVARYYTPSGETIHKKGIMPDQVVEIEQLSQGDWQSIRDIEKKKLVEQFLKKEAVYNEATKKTFRDFIKSHGITLSVHAADFALKNGIYRYKKRPLYDLEFDNQLVESVKRLTAKE